MAIRIERNHLPRIGPAIHKALVAVVPRQLQGIIDAAAPLTPVLTSSLVKSPYLLTTAESTYGEAVAASQGVNPKVEILPEVERPTHDTQGIVAWAAAHAQEIEMGGSRKAPQGFAVPAVESQRPEFVKAVAGAVRAGAKQGANGR